MSQAPLFSVRFNKISNFWFKTGIMNHTNNYAIT